MLGYKMTYPMIPYGRSNPLHDETSAHYDAMTDTEFGPLQTAEHAPFAETDVFVAILPPSGGYSDHFSDDCDAADMTHFYRPMSSSGTRISKQRFAPQAYKPETQAASFFRESESDAMAAPALWQPATAGTSLLPPPPPPAVIEGVDLAAHSPVDSDFEALTKMIDEILRELSGSAEISSPSPRYPLVRIIKSVRVTTSEHCRQSIFWTPTAPVTPPRTIAAVASPAAGTSIGYHAPRAARLSRESTEEVFTIAEIPVFRGVQQQQTVTYRFSDESVSIRCSIHEAEEAEMKEEKVVAAPQKVDQDMFNYVFV